MANKPGVYTLIIQLFHESAINVGKLGFYHFPKGLYVYSGSAIGKGGQSLKGRVGRHLISKKKMRWHIDYLLNSGSKIVAVIYAESEARMECCVIKKIVKLENVRHIVKGFGSSDCSSCESHLYFFSATSFRTLVTSINNVYKTLCLNPQILLNK
ncbi:MAG: GIY-YIG nuclease family protein [Candidatus Bathyarchaeota archaeon]|nr:MAG: GIY-YIG nuclease family protein [Candidatus Bathyarchaeota archaeon]